jgi:tetratricopeptide (TPR) repeat protein
MKSQEFWDWYESYAAPRLKGESPDHNRARTFRAMLEYLDQFDKPIIVETGCIEGVADNYWAGNGCSTIIFDKYAQHNGGQVYSVELIREKVLQARKLVSKCTKIMCNDSVAFLKGFKKTPHLLYLDASNFYWHNPTPSQVHHYNELMAMLPKLKPTTLVAVDDTLASIEINEIVKAEIVGKGGLVAKYAAEVGAEMVFTDYQTGWIGFPGLPDASDYNTDQILQKARRSVEQGKWTQAYIFYREILGRTPEPWNGVNRVMHGEACAFFARAALQIRDKRYGAAYDWYERALRADPRAADYRMEFALKVLRPLALMDMATDQAKKCTKIEPEDPMCWRALGLLEGARGNIEEALAAHSKQLELERTDFSLVDTAVSLIDLEQYEEAEPLVEEVLASDNPLFKPDAIHCKAMILTRRDQHEEAIPLYEEAIRRGCHDPTLTAFHLALSQFSIGRYKDGWANQIKIEHNTSDPALYLPMRRFDRPLWTGQPAPAVIHVHAEAGAGDNIAMWRYFPLLVERGYTVRYEIRDELLKVAQDSLKDIEVVPLALDYPGAVGLKHFDYHCPIGQLPYAFGTDIDTVPWRGPYIKADLKLAETFRNAPRIGIAWSSGIRLAETTSWLARYGRHKSLSFEDIRPLVANSGPMDFVSLQVGPPRAENDCIADILPKHPTWAETAALLANLDLVITPDTGLAHLSGAMGVPTWLLMHAYNLGWHFMSERPGAFWNERSPWYPSIRLFRQKRGEDWGPVVEECRLALQARKIRAA